MYVDVILPVPLDRLFTYHVPACLETFITPGRRLFVPFGKSRKLTGIAFRVHSDYTQDIPVKDVDSILDENGPAVLPSGLRLMQWMWQYHICSPGDVMKASLPAGLRPDNGSHECPYRPKLETYVRLGKKFDGCIPGDTTDLFSKSAKKQKAVFDCYISLAGLQDKEGQNAVQADPVSRKYLSEQCKSPSAMKALVENGYLEMYDVEVGRLPVFSGQTIAPAILSQAQERALYSIRESFRTKNVCLLHGVTSCGKTEIYIHLIQEQIRQGRQVLFLLPEIALTTQIMHRLQRVFGNDMCIYHSNCADSIRVEVWKRQTGPDPYKLILGARSAVMLPFRNLGLVIVDEEHDPSYKQEDPAPRYNARNTAIVLASVCGARTLLGSATPSLESYCNATGGKYGLVTLGERYSGMEMPEIEIVDVAEMKKRKYMQGLFSPQLIESVRQALDCGRQAMLFLNRRGYSSIVECPDCGWVQKCDCCDVSLTMHKSSGTAGCHYCGRSYRLPVTCPSCGNPRLQGRGYGTEHIEEDIRQLFPSARVARLDMDSARTGYDSILSDFQEGRTDILIGTQMISKGLDFDNVGVVGILQADSLMSYPDFRAGERAYQLMAQVAGRAGRKNCRGKVIVQTRQPDTPLLQLMRSNDYYGFYANQMEERRLFSYPPYSRLTTVWIKGHSESDVNTAACGIATRLALYFQPHRVLGPDAPSVARVQYQYIRKIIVKAGLDMTSQESRSLIEKAVNECSGSLHQVSVSFDVDPQ